MQRPKVDMDWDTFLHAMDWVSFFYARDLQKELSFTGIGESTLHPEFCTMLAHARRVCPKIPIVFSTNGMPSFTEEIAQCCEEHGIKVMISLHQPEVAGHAINLARKHGILLYTNDSFATRAFNWAGTVDWFVSAQESICAYLKNGWGVVLVDGDITTCCLDSEKKGVVGNVWDEPGSLGIKPYSLCDTCHEKIP